MKRLFVLASVVFFALSSVAQLEDTDGFYFFDSDNVVGDLATYSEKTMDVAFEAPSTIITTPGVWYNFDYYTENGKKMMRVDKGKWQFKAGGTCSFIENTTMDVDYQNIKKIDIQGIVPMGWQKTRDVLTIRRNSAQISVKCSNQNQLNKMSAREKYDMDEKLKLIGNRMSGLTSGSVGSYKLLRLDKDIMIWQRGNKTEGMVSQTGLDKLIKARNDYKKRQENEQSRREEEAKAYYEKASREAEEQSKREIERIAKLEADGGKVYEVKDVKFAMVAVEGGTFKMGNEEEYNSRPAHEVTLNGFAIGQTEVTQDLWTAVMGNNPSRIKGAKLPMERLSWNDCQTFIQKLNQLTGQQFRLPTEAEWEYAARGGNQSKGYKYSGSDNLEEVAWYSGNSNNKLHVAAEKAPNELGIYDMSGNVYEWCQDWKGKYSFESVSNPTGPDFGEGRVVRGGSYIYPAFVMTVDYRSSTKPELSLNGFRLAQ